MLVSTTPKTILNAKIAAIAYLILMALQELIAGILAPPMISPRILDSSRCMLLPFWARAETIPNAPRSPAQINAKHVVKKLYDFNAEIIDSAGRPAMSPMEILSTK